MSCCSNNAVFVCAWDMSIPATDLQASQERLTLPDVRTARWPERRKGTDGMVEADQREKQKLVEYTVFNM